MRSFWAELWAGYGKHRTVPAEPRRFFRIHYELDNDILNFLAWNGHFLVLTTNIFPTGQVPALR
jgi:hypothetical protein